MPSDNIPSNNSSNNKPSDHQVPHLLTASDIANLPEVTKLHFLNANVVRNTKSLSDLVGMKNLGIHLVRVESGKETTEFHFHEYEEEFIYIISGRGIAEIGDREIEVGAGDFMGFTAPSLPHGMRNPFAEDLVYLMGGERLDFDISEYPKKQKRNFRSHQQRQIVDFDNIATVT
ncbi:cupin domain-containing protein [Pseudanabaena sp. UWO310]|uniref:cupin domain-containing protein n=1 Tax=Pseudanabaena sp. UWO310 TaxID=2480795 RepID=UPI0011603D81|nr:cupin domain-containing protein [Pseudanabaena sp. UWO310]TYQ25062.1 cupin domain-containing protein [Pseudanabaena sp. UWO310]